MPEDFLDEDLRATELLVGKVVRKVFRHRESELCIEFEDETRIFIDTNGAALEISIT
jgi:hypothetical protein